MNQSWAWQLMGCFKKGSQAFVAGLKDSDCPYFGNGVNGQRRSYWLQGYRAAAKEQLQQENSK